jgi:hypothetical protein
MSLFFASPLEANVLNIGMTLLIRWGWNALVGLDEVNHFVSVLHRGIRGALAHVE